MVDDLDVVAVGIEHERGVVALVVVGPLTGLAIAPMSRGDRVGVKPPDRVVVAGEGDVGVLGRLAGEDAEHATGSSDRKPGALSGLAADRQSRDRTDRRVERGRRFQVADPDGDVIDVAPGSFAVAVDGLEAVACRVLEKRRVVIVGVVRDAAGGPVVYQAGVDTGLPEAVDVVLSLRDEGDVQALGDRMLVVLLAEQEVPPAGERRCVSGLLDPEFLQRSAEGTGGERNVWDSRLTWSNMAGSLVQVHVVGDRRAVGRRRHHAWLGVRRLPSTPIVALVRSSRGTGRPGAQVSSRSRSVSWATDA